MSTRSTSGRRGNSSSSRRGEIDPYSNATYPLFVEASNYTTDKMWKEMLLNAAFGRLPEKFSFDNSGSLVFKRKVSNRIRYNKVPLPETALELADVFISFIKSNAQICSETDIEISKRESDLSTDDNRRIKKDISEASVDEYVKECSKVTPLTPSQYASLVRCIYNGFRLGVLQNYSVIDGKSIKQVNYIIYDHTTDSFHIDPSIIPEPRKLHNVIQLANVREPRLLGKRPKAQHMPPKSKAVSLDSMLDRTVVDRIING